MRMASHLRQTLTAPAQVEVRCLLKGPAFRKSKGPDNRSDSPFRPSSRATTAHERPCHSAAALIERQPSSSSTTFCRLQLRAQGQRQHRETSRRAASLWGHASRPPTCLEQPRPTSRAFPPEQPREVCGGTTQYRIIRFRSGEIGQNSSEPRRGLTASGSTKPTFLAGAIEYLPGWVTVH